MNKYLRAVSTNVIYFIINTIFFLVITPVSIHVMGVEFFGLWSILNAIVLLTGVGTLGIGAIVNKFAAEMHESEIRFTAHSNKVITAGGLIVLPMSVITASILVSLRHFIAGNLDVTPFLQIQFSIAMLLVASAILPQFLSRILQGYLLSQYKNGLVRRIETIYTILLWTGAVLIAFYRKDLILVALWCFLDALLLLVMYFITLRRLINFRLRLDLLLIKRMIGFSGYMFIESVAIALFQQMDRIVVGFVLGPATAGVYSVGTSVGLRVSIISGQATEVMIPYASLKESANDRLRLYAAFHKLSRYISLLVASLGGILVLWMEEILSIWISPAYARENRYIFSLLIVGYGLLSLSRPAHQTLTGIGKVKVTSLIYTVSTLCMLTGLYLLSRYFGFVGAALANLVPVLLLTMNLYAYKWLTHRLSIREIFGDLKWGLLLPFLMFAFMFFEPVFWLKVLLTAGLGVLVIISVSKEDWARSGLMNQVKRVVHRFVPYA